MRTGTGAARAARVRALVAAVAAGLAGGCTTSLGDGTLGGYDKSTLIALSDPVVGMTVSGSSVYWVDDTGSVWSCDKVSCGNAPKRLYEGPNPIQSSVLLGVSGDWLFWVNSGSLFGCPTSGCPAGTLAPLATLSEPGDSASAFAIDTAGGTGVYWVDEASPNGSGDESPAVLRYTPDCDAGCPETVFQWSNTGQSSFPTLQCGSDDPSCTPCMADTDCVAGQFCTLYPGGPTTAACSLQLSPGGFCMEGSSAFSSPSACVFGTCDGSCPQPQPSTGLGIAIAGGNVYFVSSSLQSTILSCPVSGCSLSTLSTYWTAPAMGGAPTIFGASATALYFHESEDSSDLESCGLPTCAGTPATVASNATALVAFSPTDFYVVEGYDDSATACPLSGCSSGSTPVTPDPGLDSTALGIAPNARPFALDGTAIVWATSTVFGQPGNQIVRTATP